jgi:hypothetical protein
MYEGADFGELPCHFLQRCYISLRIECCLYRINWTKSSHMDYVFMCGAMGLSVGWVENKCMLLWLYVGWGAWAICMPYAMISGVLPRIKLALYGHI